MSVLVLLVFLFTGCSVQPEEIEINRCFTAKAQIQYQSTALTADFTSNESGCSAVFSSPEKISGLTFSTDGNTTVYSLGELKFTAEETGHQTQLINAVYSAIVSLPETATLNEQTYILQGVSKYGNYIMYINKDDFIPTYIEYEDKNITVKFSEIT